MKNETVLEVGVEGGSIKLLGTKLSQGWRFRVLTVDLTATFLSKEDRGNLTLENQHASAWVGSWEAAQAFSTHTRGTDFIRLPFILNSNNRYGRLSKGNADATKLKGSLYYLIGIGRLSAGVNSVG